MSRLTNKQRILAFDIRGKWGRPSSYGRAHFGFNIIAADDSFSGIFQKATFANGRDLSVRPFYWPRNPQTPLQQANRQKLADAVMQWGVLTPTEKSDYNDRSRGRARDGYRFFIKEYLKTH